MHDLSSADEPRQSNLQQFAQFVREHEGGLYTYVLRLVGQREDAEDITQEALLQAYRTWQRVEPGAAAGYVKWCYRIAHNLAIDSLRKSRPRPVEDDEMEHTADARSPRPEEIYEHRFAHGPLLFL